MATFSLLALLSACGGDSGSTPGPTPTPTPATPNTPPGFTSAATASIVENTSTAYVATVSDADNDPITVTISGGPDAALFAIDATGKVSFATPPNYDMPGDADGNNVYEITLRASDGKTATTLDAHITVTNDREGMATRRVATGFVQPLWVYRVAGSDDELYVVDKGGAVYRLNTRTGARAIEFIVDNLSTDGERGLLGLTIGPRDLSGGTAAYVMATTPDGTIQLRQYVRGPDGRFDGSPPNILLSIPHPGYNVHNGGWIEFGPDGLLYIAVGDGGGTGDPNNNAQNPNSRLGKILRLALGAGGWGPAPGNPYASGGGDPYVFALGLRNPFRNAFEGNSLIIADVGQDAVEEVNVIGLGGGANFGWPYREGTQGYRGTAPGGLTDPLLQYGHGPGPFQGASLIGGQVYHGGIAALSGHYLFADYVSKHIWSVPYARLASGPLLDGRGFELRDADLAPDVGSINMPVAFGTDGAGRMYIVDLDGEIYEIVAAPASL
ncbi:MAG: PQQ-dependent sugar dehydrogenase [Sphingobium sp.]|nr:PQQ-dependent sugar dehydrogenase [Sphingobium sp.]